MLVSLWILRWGVKEEFGVFWKVRRRTEGIFVRWERRQVGVGGDLRVDETVGLLSTWCVARPTFWHFWVPCFFLGPGGVLWEKKSISHRSHSPLPLRS